MSVSRILWTFMFEHLIHYMNFTSVHSSTYSTATSPVRLSNDTWTSHLGDLQVGLVLQMLFINEDRNQAFKFAFTFLVSSLVMIVHSPKPLPNWMNISTISNRNMADDFCCVFCIVCIHDYFSWC